jgi:hypothetical protein
MSIVLPSVFSLHCAISILYLYPLYDLSRTQKLRSQVTKYQDTPPV